MHKARRRSNSMGHIEDQYVKSKFETDEELVLDETTEKVDTASSTSSDATDKS